MTGVSLCVGTMERPDSDSMSGGDRQTRVISLDSEARHGILGMLKIVSPRSNGENGMRRFTITDIVEGNGQSHPAFTHTATYPVLEVLLPGNGNLPGFLVAEDRKSTRLNSSHANISY